MDVDGADEEMGEAGDEGEEPGREAMDVEPPDRKPPDRKPPDRKPKPKPETKKQWPIKAKALSAIITAIALKMRCFEFGLPEARQVLVL